MQFRVSTFCFRIIPKVTANFECLIANQGNMNAVTLPCLIFYFRIVPKVILCFVLTCSYGNCDSELCDSAQFLYLRAFDALILAINVLI